MIISMTGFGRGEASSDGISVTVELKSVNSRYLDISIRMPQVIQEKELELKEQIQEHISRGKLNANIRVDKSDTGEPDVTINPKLVEGYTKLLNNLKKAAGIEEPVSLKDLMNFNEIFVSREQDEEVINTIWELSQKAVQDGLEQLITMRKQEGQQLENDHCMEAERSILIRNVHQDRN
ncbi:MAG: YicC/YloC family endoribonuclease [Balneolaceae bacterium]|nr:YicC/YloC family endoribonuclease [Balneolaceae bacterium]